MGDEEEQKAFAKRIAKESLSVRVTEQLVSEHIQRADGEPLKVFSGDGTSAAAPVSGSEHVAQLEDQLRLALGTKVDLRQSAKGKGKITIHFANNEEFDRIRAILTGGNRPTAKSVSVRIDTDRLPRRSAVGNIHRYAFCWSQRSRDQHRTGRSSAWLERLLWEQEAACSNHVAPTFLLIL